MARAKKNEDKLLVEFIPYGGKKINVYDWNTGKESSMFTKKDFKKYFGISYKYTKGASFGKATDKGVQGWGIFIPRMKR